MRCPYCLQDDHRVIDSRPTQAGSAIRRRRACGSCGQRFSTIERTEEVPLKVVKRNGSVEPFQKRKLAAGIGESVKNLGLDDELVAATTAQVEARLRSQGRARIETSFIGTEVLAALRDLHEVAYMRFASVYKGFTSPEDFRRELASLEKRAPRESR